MSLFDQLGLIPDDYHQSYLRKWAPRLAGATGLTVLLAYLAQRANRTRDADEEFRPTGGNADYDRPSEATLKAYERWGYGPEEGEEMAPPWTPGDRPDWLSSWQPSWIKERRGRP